MKLESSSTLNDFSLQFSVHSELFKSITIAPFALLRVGLLPVETLDEFVSKKLVNELRDYYNLRKELHLSAQDLAQEIEKNVPFCIDKWRLNLIKLKRDLFNRRQPLISKEFERYLNEINLNSRVEKWIQDLKMLDLLYKSLEDLILEDTKNIYKSLCEQWNNPLLKNGITAAAPSLASQLERDWRNFKEKKKRSILRSLFSYVTRASAKTSPFSTLTYNCFIDFNEIAETTLINLDSVRTECESRINRGIVCAIKNSVVSSYIETTDIKLRLNPTIQISEGRLEAVSNHYLLRRGGLWVEQYAVRMAIAELLADAIKKLPSEFTWEELKAHCLANGISESSAYAVMRMLLQKDLIRSGFQWSGNCNSPVRFLVSALRNVRNNSLKEINDVLLKFEKLGDRFAHSIPSKRISIIKEVSETYAGLRREMSSNSLPDFRNFIYENSWSDGVAFCPGPLFERIYKTLGEVLSSKIRVSRDYIWLRKKFVEEFGVGGECRDVQSFLLSSYSKISELVALYRQNYTKEEISDSFFGIDMQKISVPLTMYVQLVKSEKAPLDSKESKFVLNMAFSRIAWQAARYTRSSESADRALRQWIERVSHNAIPLGINIAGECNMLQETSRLTSHTLDLETVSTEENNYRLKDLTIKHNETTNLLDLYVRNGKLVRGVYLGGAMPQIAWGPRFLAILLGEPFEVTRAPSKLLFAQNDDSAKVRYQKRIEEDGCILVRASWQVRSAFLLERIENRNNVDKLLAAYGFCEEFMIPRWVYAKGQVRDLFSEQAPQNIEKPMWTDLKNLICIEDLLLLARKTEWIILREALPTFGQHALQIKGRDHISEFMFEGVFSGSYCKA